MRSTRIGLKKQQSIRKAVALSVIKNLFSQNKLDRAIEIAQLHNISEKEFKDI